MGEFIPVLVAASSVIGTASKLSEAQQQKKYQAQQAAIQTQQAQNDINALEAQKAQAEQDRRERLERTTASQRAAFAASGVSGDGSGNAVFDNLLQEAGKERDSYNANIDHQIQSLQSGIQLNLLKRPSSYGALDAIGSLASGGASFIRAGQDAGWFKK
jgi:hypothetical protein